MKPNLILSASALFLSALTLYSMEPQRDTINHRKFTDELGFFQKAERELSDPRFMFHDDKFGMDLGIGGTVGIMGSYTYAGAIQASSFAPAKIDVPSDFSNSFMANLSECELHAKARMSIKNHKIVAFLKIRGDQTKVAVNQAYISLDGFSAGLIPTFFSDLEAGVHMEGCCAPQADLGHPLFGYTLKKNGWEFAVAAEEAAFSMDSYQFAGIGSNYQPMPDMTLHIKTRWKWGHVQLGAIFRNLTYWARPEGTLIAAEGKNGHCPGWGLALSGNIKPSEKLKLSYFLEGGRGIAKYMSIFSPLNLEVALSKEEQDGYSVLETVPLLSGSLMAQYNWTDFLTSSAVLQYAKCFSLSDASVSDNVSHLIMGAVNIFWNIGDFADLGLEYMYGRRNEYADYSLTPGQPYGNAHNFSIFMKYMF